MELARGLIRAHAVPSESALDAVHGAIAVVNSVDYLATWNLRHTANSKPVPRIEQFCRDNGYTPTVVPPAKSTRRNVQDPELDPIVAELREIRTKMAARFDNDPGAIIEYVERKRNAAEGNIGGLDPSRSAASALEEQSGDHSDS